MTQSNRVYTVEEAAAQLRVSSWTVYQRVKDRLWPCTRMGRKIVFTPEQINEILASCVQPAVTRTPRRRIPA